MISSSRLRHLRSLHRARGRASHGEYLAEGAKITIDMLTNHPEQIIDLYVTPELHAQYDEIRQWPAGGCHLISEAEMKQISQLVHPPGVVLRCKMLVGPLPDTVRRAFYLDGIRDPGNMGTILRICDWYGLPDLLVSKDCVERYNPKVVQAAMGSVSRVRVHQSSPESWSGRYPVVYGTFPDGNSDSAVLAMDGICIIGSESHGIRSELLPLITHRISISSLHSLGAESLNAAMTTAILADRWIGD